MEWEFEAELWLWDPDEPGAWTFLTVPDEIGDELRLSGPPRGFGSVRVEVTIGSSTWRTSVFPDNKRGYLLPVKKTVREAEGVDAGDVASVLLTLAD